MMQPPNSLFCSCFRSQRPNLWAVVGCGLSLALATLVFFVVVLAAPKKVSAADSKQRREEDWKRISAMSVPEREQLKRNLKTFRELPEAEKNRMRQLQMQLEKDKKSGGNLNQVLSAYYEWLTTLTPGQRSDLQNEPDPIKRRRIVAELLQKQPESNDVPGSRRRRLAMSASDLAAVMTVLEKSLVERAFLIESKLGEKQGIDRYSIVLQAAFPPGTRDPNPEWLTPELFDSMVGAIEDEETRRILSRFSDRRRRTGQLFFAVFSTVMGEFRKQSEEIDPAKLEKFFVEMKGEQQDEIMRMPFDTQAQRLRMMYMRAHPDEFPQPPSQPPWINQLMRVNRGMPGGPGGPGFGPPNRPELGGPNSPDGVPAGGRDGPDERRPNGPNRPRIRPRDRNTERPD